MDQSVIPEISQCKTELSPGGKYSMIRFLIAHRRARQKNLSQQVAGTRILEARAQLGIAPVQNIRSFNRRPAI